MARTKTKQLQSGGGVCAADRCPDTMGPSPKVDNEAQAQHGLQLLRWINSRLQTVQAAMEAELALVRQKYAAELQLDVDGEDVPLEVYAAALEAALVRYGERNGKRLFRDEATRNYAAGQLLRHQSSSPTVSWRDDKTDEQQQVARIVEQLECTRRLVILQEKLQPLVCISTRLDRQAILAARREGNSRATDEVLQRFGLQCEKRTSVKVRLDDRKQHNSV